MRKYKNETEFLILSINKIKMTQDLIKEKQMKELNQEINEIKNKIDNEQNKDEKKNMIMLLALGNYLIAKMK